MIVSASRREDVPAFRAEFLAAALQEGEAPAVNPFNPKQVKRVSLRPEDVRGVVLWSKNPASLLRAPLREALEPYAFYIQYTLNGYDADLEPGVPKLFERVDTYRRLCDALGPKRVRWRYDPVALTPAYTPEGHAEIFAGIAEALRGYATHCTISFLDSYRRIERAMRELAMRPPDAEEALRIARMLADIARPLGIALFTCAEPGDYAALGIGRGACVDAVLLAQIAGKPFAWKKDGNQRPHCACAQSVDIGRYGHCPHDCRYCYAQRAGRS